MSAPGAFRNQSWANRFTVLGDEAESHFEEYCKREKRGFVRYGLNRPPIAVHRIPTRLRYTPDFLTTKALVEVQGFGRDAVVKLKLEKWGSLHWWHDLHPVEMYLWDSTNEREIVVPLNLLDGLLADGKGSLDAFPEGKAFFALPADAIFEAGSAA